ncbi:unnamed protein product, partial [Rotaria magnacalcarata]
IDLIKNIHRPFWSSLFSIPVQDDSAIDQLAESLEQKAMIKN